MSVTLESLNILLPQQAPKMNELNMDQSGSGQSEKSQQRRNSWDATFWYNFFTLFYVSEIK